MTCWVIANEGHSTAHFDCLAISILNRNLIQSFLLLSSQLTKIIAVAFVASATAFVPAHNARMPTKLNFEYGEYDEKLFDNNAKKDLYTKWDPNSPRSTRNFNPFETYKGNSCDASGIYPGEVSARFVILFCRLANHFPSGE